MDRDRTDRHLRVLMVCARYPPCIGGTEAHVKELGRRLAARGHEVHVLTTVLTATEVGEQLEDRVRVRRVRAYPSWSDVYFAPGIHRAVLESQADIVHVQGYHTLVAPLAIDAARRAGVPTVLTFHSGGHSSPVRRMVRPLHQRILAPAVRRADRSIGVSDFEARWFTKRMRLVPARLQTITNGVSEEFQTVQPSRDRFGSAGIVSIGRLERYKRHDAVIAAMPQVRAAIPGATLTVVGEGSAERDLVGLVEALDLGDVVRFVAVPYGDRRQLAELLGAARVVAIASKYESQGIAGLEAIATGARLVVAGGSGLEELRRFDGVSVVQDVEHDLAGALIDQLRRPPLVTRAQVPGWDDIVASVESLYRDVIAERRGEGVAGRCA